MVVLTQTGIPLTIPASPHPMGTQRLFVIDMPYGPQAGPLYSGRHRAAFHPALQTDRADVIIRKGMNPADPILPFSRMTRSRQQGLPGC